MFNISEAKAQLSSIIEKVVSRGAEVIIGKAGKPVAKLVRYDPTKKNKRLGLMKSKIKISRDFDKWPDDIAESLGMKENR